MTFLIDELVHRTTTSGFATSSALAASSETFDAETLRQTDDVAEIAADFGRIDVDGADNFESGPRGNLLDDSRANRAEPEVHHSDVGHNLRIILTARRSAPLARAWYDARRMAQTIPAASRASTSSGPTVCCWIAIRRAKT